MSRGNKRKDSGSVLTLLRNVLFYVRRRRQDFWSSKIQVHKILVACDKDINIPSKRAQKHRIVIWISDWYHLFEFFRDDYKFERYSRDESF